MPALASLALGLWMSFASPPDGESEATGGGVAVEDETGKKTKRKKRKRKRKKKKDPNDPNRLEFGVLPAVAYDIDLGLGFGALVTLAKFHPKFQPYKWRLEILAYATAKNIKGLGVRVPFHDDYIKGDFPGLWDGRLRINANIRFRRFTNQGWYGIGNASVAQNPWEMIDQEEDPDAFAAARRYHQYDRIYPSLTFNARIILWDQSKIGNDALRPCGPKRRERCPPHQYNGVDGKVGHKRRLEVLAGTSLAYNIINPYDDSKYSEDLETREMDTEDGETLRGLLHGVDNHALWNLNFGLLYDTRDHEYSTTNGSFTELSGQFSPGVDDGLLYGRLYLGHSVFIPLYDEFLVLAARGSLDYLFGKPPVYELGRFGVLTPLDGPGGSWSIRGVPRQRYFGKQKAILNTELRTMFVRFNIANQRFGLGALAYVDAGRLWTDYSPVTLGGEDVDGPFGNIKWGFGGGLRITWGETLVIRADPAWSPSDQNFGFYLDIGHMF